MLPRSATVLVALALAVTGCISKDQAPVEDDLAPADVNDTGATNATLPTGEESAGIKETNITEEGVGGIEHRHDYWEGKEQILLFDESVNLFCPPCMPDGEGTQPKAVAYVKLDKLPEDETKDALVYEGADRVEILLDAPEAVPGSGLAHPAAPKVFLQYRSAKDSDWNPPMDVTFGTPLVIELDALMTDMPHSVHSLWVFRLTSDRPELSLDVPMKVTVFKGRDVVDWPGHPDFYADKDERIVMQQHVTTHMSGIESFALYDTGGSWAHPEKLISWGTKELLVTIKITSIKNAYNAPATGYFLEVHNATVIGPEITFGDRYSELNGKNDLQTYQFAVPVDEIGMDGPYQPASRWGFRAMATFADIDGVIGFCPGCFPYDIEYDIEVIAYDHETGAIKE